jgi:hypothetical protein
VRNFLRMAYGSSALARFFLGLFGVRFDKSYTDSQAEAREWMMRSVWKRKEK